MKKKLTILAFNFLPTIIWRGWGRNANRLKLAHFGTFLLHWDKGKICMMKPLEEKE